jgi:hypothetical protein
MLRLVDDVNKAGRRRGDIARKSPSFVRRGPVIKEMNVRHPGRMTAGTVRMASGDCQLCAVARAVMTPASWAQLE